MHLLRMIPSPQRNVGRKNADEVIFCHINGDIDQEMKKEKENNKKDFEIAISVAYRK